MLVCVGGRLCVHVSVRGLHSDNTGDTVATY